MSVETRAAIIGAVIGALISGVISVWSVKRMEVIEDQNRMFQERIEESSLSRTLGASRAGLLSSVAIEILRKYGDVTSVISMSSVEWYQLNSYQNMLEILGADEAKEKLAHLYKKTDRKNIAPGQPGRDDYYEDLEALTQALRKAVDSAYE
ncbi:hypothetical protein [Sessilibacter corallicola]|uniref:hypothetical protein n=1 Tax=Sessilibacter corallicola TaxID=2904075 RepID=UPI001E437A95|nr:hypothetical protein [Sessilibacter corallicola]MCE2029554.1 hypothetical protein [Sessilibacter corallicola]